MAKSNKTAAELLAELNKNDSYKETIESKEKERKVDQNILQEDELRISSALREVGISINTIYDLVNTNNPYPKAIPILIDFLENKKVQHNQVIEGVIRALAVKEAVSIANRHLIKLYNESVKEDATFCWAIGNTVDAIVCDDDIDDVIKIVKDKSNGVSRQMFVMALGKVKSVKAEQALISLLDDDEVSPHALDALGRLKSPKAKSKISELTNHQKPLIRKEAQKALKMLMKNINNNNQCIILTILFVLLANCSNTYHSDISKEILYSYEVEDGVSVLGCIDTILLLNPIKKRYTDELSIILKCKVINNSDTILTINLSNNSMLSTSVIGAFQYHKKEYYCKFVYGQSNMKLKINPMDSACFGLVSEYYYEDLLTDFKLEYISDMKHIANGLKIYYNPYYLHYSYSDTIVPQEKNLLIICNEKTRVFMSNDYAGFFGYKVE